MSVSYFRKCYHRVSLFVRRVTQHLSTDARRRSVRRTLKKTLSLRERNGYKRHYERSPENWSIFRRPVETDNEAECWQLPLNHKVKTNIVLHFYLCPTYRTIVVAQMACHPDVRTSRLTQIFVQIGRLLLLMLLTMHEDASVGSWATSTVAVADWYGWTTLCALAEVAALIPVITVRGAFTTVVTVKTSPSRVWQVWSLLQQLKYQRAETVLLF